MWRGAMGSVEAAGLPLGYKAGKEQWDRESYEVVGRRTIEISAGGQM